MSRRQRRVVQIFPLIPRRALSLSKRNEGCGGLHGKAEQAKEPSGRKRPHTPRSGVQLKSAEAVQKREDNDPGAKAPHDDSSEEGMSSWPRT